VSSRDTPNEAASHRPDQAVKYRTVAHRLHSSARDLSEIADDDRYGNAIGILVVHAAIAWADSVSIACAGYKSDTVSYQGVAYSLVRATGMLGKLDSFAAWAEGLYEARPA
jgi:hypothetical protein